MMGCAAAILGEPDQVALLFEQPVGQHSDAALSDSTISDNFAAQRDGEPASKDLNP